MMSNSLLAIQVRLSFRWWLSTALSKRLEFREPMRVTGTTDMSLFGWGALMESKLAQGHWTATDPHHNINWLELKAARLALRHFQPDLEHRHVLLFTDNMATKAHVNRHTLEGLVDGHTDSSHGRRDT